MNFDIPQNLIKEQLLHNLTEYLSSPWANQIVNKDLNGESCCLSNLSFYRFVISDVYKTFTVLGKEMVDAGHHR